VPLRNQQVYEEVVKAKILEVVRAEILADYGLWDLGRILQFFWVPVESNSLGAPIFVSFPPGPARLLGDPSAPKTEKEVG
jgi:hypothetical protein